MTENRPAANPFTPPQATLDGAAEGIDSTFELKLFSPTGRIGRIRYLAYSMGLSFLVLAIAGILAAVIGPWLIGLGYLVMLYLQVMLAIKRSHDFNTSGWLSLITFIPVANLIFLFVPGTDGANRFGNRPPANGKVTVVAILLLVGVFIVGILAAIAIPAYQDYVNRARAAQTR